MWRDKSRDKAESKDVVENRGKNRNRKKRFSWSFKEADWTVEGAFRIVKLSQIVTFSDLPRGRYSACLDRW